MPAPSDPSVSVQTPEILITLGGQQFTIPSLPASQWLSILLDPSPDGTRIIPGFLPQAEQDQLDEMLFSERLEPAELRETINEAITITSGHDWWWTLNLLSATRGEQGTLILGKMARYNPDQMPLAAWVNALYALLTEHAKDSDRIQLDSQLAVPPPDVEATISEVDVDASTAAFFGMMRQN